jgi:hypothetical protein
MCTVTSTPQEDAPFPELILLSLRPSILRTLCRQKEAVLQHFARICSVFFSQKWARRELAQWAEGTLCVSDLWLSLYRFIINFKSLCHYLAPGDVAFIPPSHNKIPDTHLITTNNDSGKCVVFRICFENYVDNNFSEYQMRLSRTKYDNISLTVIIVPLTLSPLSLLWLVRQDTYTVNLCVFYFCRLIGKLTVFFFNIRSSVSVIQHSVPLPSHVVLLTTQDQSGPHPGQGCSRCSSPPLNPVYARRVDP